MSMFKSESALIKNRNFRLRLRNWLIWFCSLQQSHNVWIDHCFIQTGTWDPHCHIQWGFKGLDPSNETLVNHSPKFIFPKGTSEIFQNVISWFIRSYPLIHRYVPIPWHYSSRITALIHFHSSIFYWYVFIPVWNLLALSLSSSPFPAVYTYFATFISPFLFNSVLII